MLLLFRNLLSFTKIQFKNLVAWLKIHRKVVLIPLIIIAVLMLGLTIWLFKDVPNPSKLTRQPAPVSTQIFDRHGKLLYEIFLERNRTPIALNDMPPYLAQATISIEDKNFYHHFGLDPVGIIRAAFNTLTGKRLEGGSTITQQLVKNALIADNSRTLVRKIKEAALAVLTEITYSKQLILELYLNYTPYGGTAYGIEAASQQYFDKPAKDLSLPEAALLAGLPQSPTSYSPFSHPNLAKERQKQVLNRMKEDGYINQKQFDEALDTPLKYTPKESTIKAPHFVFWVRDLLIDRYGADNINIGGLRVTTTLDLDLQQAAQASLSAEVNKIARLKISNGAALVTKPKTGEVLAMIGSRNYFDPDHDGQVNVTTSLRQPGSSIKPVNYALGLLNGWTASTMFLDIPTCFSMSGQQLYCPKNYDNTWHGPVQMRFALGNSYNIPAVKVLALNSIESMVATASAMGITGWNDPSKFGLSLTLGGGEVKMIDMAVAFGVFANSGVKVPLNPILKVETYQGKVLEENNRDQLSDITDSLRQDWNTFHNSPRQTSAFNGLTDQQVSPTPESPYQKLLSGLSKPNPSPTPNAVLQPVYQPVTVLPEEVAYIVSHMLLDPNARVGAFGSNSQLVVPGKTVSVKSGTTNDQRDNWTIGYTPDYLVATWVGNNDNSPMSYVASGVTGASPIWNQIMKYILKGKVDHFPTQPSGVVNAQVCAVNGLVPTPENPCDTRTELFVKDHLPEKNIPARKQIWVHSDTHLPPLPGEDTSNLVLEEHAVFSDPFSTDFCIDCAYSQETKPDPANPSNQIPTGKINYPQINIDFDKFHANTPRPDNWIKNLLPTLTPTP